MLNMRYLSLLLVAAFAFSIFAQTQSETPQQRDQRMQWWREARFGMFIHWGLYAVAGGEWKGQPVKGAGEWIMHTAKIPPKEYEETLLPQFNPVKFDAKKWVDIAKGAGMKYIVITSKHHDGFSLYDSQANPYNVMKTPFKRDIMKELSDAAHAGDVKMCWYHSILDWHHPDANKEHWADYSKVLHAQVAELLHNYGPIGIMWFDGDWIPEWSEEQGREMYAFCREQQPSVIVNNRVGKGRQGMSGVTKGNAAGDYGTPELEIPKGQLQEDWETCMTMNDTWGFKKNDNNWKSEQTLIRMLVDTASKGGNFLLNVGPTPEGEIPQASVERLAKMGEWMKTNSESIYGTSAGPVQGWKEGRTTRKGDVVYVHVFEWPKDGVVVLPLKQSFKTATLLAKPDAEVKVEKDGENLRIKVPATAPDANATVIKLQ
jgi:alpha-L-fucosidase